jgi:hypothetical protein
MITKILWLLATFLLVHVQVDAAQHPAKIPRLNLSSWGRGITLTARIFRSSTAMPSGVLTD